MAATPFTKKLIKWYKKTARLLPWRNTRDPYKIWISEIMLQQTTVKAVIPYYHRWLDLFPDVQSVAKAPPQKILKAWQGLGYYQRAKNIHGCARIIVKKHSGQFPASVQEMAPLPGFGPYTTGAVASIAFDQPCTIIDTNVRRVVMRLLNIHGRAVSAHDKRINKFLNEVLPEKGAGTFNQALMELGALVCRSREPLCGICPVRDDCRAYQKGLQEMIPEPNKKVITQIHVVIGLMEKDGQYFIQQRPPRGLFADLWEFPGGKVEKGEKPREALRRELREELGVDLQSCRRAFNVKQLYTEFKADLDVWYCDVTPDLLADRTHKWVKTRNLRKYPMPSGSARIVDQLTTK